MFPCPRQSLSRCVATPINSEYREERAAKPRLNRKNERLKLLMIWLSHWAYTHTDR